MPYISKGVPTKKSGTYRTKHDYKYPEGLNLTPGNKLHDFIRDQVWERAGAARLELQKRFSSWNEIDRTLTAYVDLTKDEEDIVEKDESKPVSIVFPYSYSMLEALLTYLSMAFFQDPIFQYEGVEDSDTVGAMLMEMVIKLHCNKTKVPLYLHTAYRDALSYGISAVIPEWVRKRGRKPVRNQSILESELGRSTVNNISFSEELLFEGNAISNIDPYMLLPDPSVSSIDIQKGEFIGWVDRTNYMSLLSEESQVDSGLFNVKYLTDKSDKRSVFALDESERQTRYGGDSELPGTQTNVVNPVDVIKMYITLIPKDFGPSDSDDRLSDSEIPEKWYFELASDDIVIKCEKADHNHGMYPVAIASPEFDGYSMTPIGRMEILYGLQHTLDFLFNSHVANVRKAVNDMLVVDPYLVNIEDLRDPKPGKLVRLRRPAWGRGVDKVVQQLAVQDITRLNISDSAYITQWMDRISGADQSMQGALRMSGPERLTSSEFQGTRGSAISRLQRIAMIIGMQFMQDIGTMFAVHTQQYMQKDTYVKIVGRYAEQLQKTIGSTIRVTPYDLAINYDLVVRDGSIPGGNFSQSWIDLFKVIGAQPELMQQFDVTRIFMYIAQQMGAKNVEDFRRNVNQVQPTVLPDETVARQVEAGNFIPVGAQ